MTPIPRGARVCLHQAFRCCPYAGMVSSQIHDYLAANGLLLETDPAMAEVHLVNTCGSDARQAQLTWDALARIRAARPDAVVITTGCLVSIEPLVMRERLAAFAERASFDPRHLAGLDTLFDPVVPFDSVQPSLHNQYTGNDFAEGWVHVLASTGCVGTCRFCAIRRATGRPKSRDIPSILADIERAVATGVHDVLLVSTDLSAWGTDRGQTVVDLVSAVSAAEGDFLVSGESFDPTFFLAHFDALLPMFTSGKWAFLGLPLQSGSARVLASMERGYTPEAVLEAVATLKARAPDLLIRTDLLYGFGDETEAEFEASILASRHFDLPSFNAYQQRPGTDPVRLPEAVVRARRDRALAEMQARAQAGLPNVRRWTKTVPEPSASVPPADAPPGTWRFVGAHAGVRVWREGEGFDARFLKVVNEAPRAEREAAILASPLPFRTPALLASGRFDIATTGSSGAAGWLLTADARRGTSRPQRLLPEMLPAAARILAGLHRAPLTGLPPPAAWVGRMRERARNPRLPERLRGALARLVLVGDAPCHLDLHASNWIVDGGQPVGLLDFGSAGMADPEFDLAATALAAGADPAGVPLIAEAWSAAAGRAADEPRVLLWLWLLLAERRIEQRKASPWEDEVAAAALAGEPQGSRRLDRCFPKVEWEGDWRPEIGLWRWVGDEGGPLLRAHGVPARVTGSYQRHACNDVLRVQPDGAWAGVTEAVLKVYNKPAAGTLFELEAALSSRLAGSAAAVLAPVPLPDGRALFRVDGRVAALYPFAGDARPGNTGADIARLARALAALHAASELAEAFPEIERIAEDLPWEVVSSHLAGVAEAEVIRRAREWAEVELAQAELPTGLCHGSLHRDHAAVLPDGRLAILDLEKIRVGPLLHDAVRSAVYAGYRGNDERADPRRIVHFLRSYHSSRPMTDPEREALPAAVVHALVRECKAIGQEGGTLAQRQAHAAVVVEFFHNRENLAEAARRFLTPALREPVER